MELSKGFGNGKNKETTLVSPPSKVSTMKDLVLPRHMFLTLDQVMLNHVMMVYESTNKNKIQTAKILGIGRATLYRYLKQIGTV
jgi:transcriptional regulator of acetoin/glycerol metabolism